MLYAFYYSLDENWWFPISKSLSCHSGVHPINTIFQHSLKIKQLLHS